MEDQPDHLYVGKRENLLSLIAQSYLIHGYKSRLFTVQYFSIQLTRSSTLHYGQPSRMSVKTTYGAGDSLGGGEKNRRTILTSLQHAFRGRDRNFMPGA